MRVIDRIRTEELDASEEAVNKLPVSIETSIYDQMQCGVCCAIEHFQDKQSTISLEEIDEDETGLEYIGTGRSGSLDNVVDIAKSLISEIKLWAEDSESIIKDTHIDEMMHVILVQIYELELHCRRRVN